MSSGEGEHDQRFDTYRSIREIKETESGNVSLLTRARAVIYTKIPKRTHF